MSANQSIQFPVYRKYSNGSSFYKIISPVEFEEIQWAGSQFIVHHIIAKIYPDKVLIQDMIDNKDGIWVLIPEKEYEEERKKSLR